MVCLDVCEAIDCVADDAMLAEALRARKLRPLPESTITGPTRYEIENETVLDELLDLLAPHHASADIFLPIRADTTFLIDRVRYASVRSLRRGLVALREELELDLPREQRSAKKRRLRNLWRTVRLAANEAAAGCACLTILRQL